MDRHHLFSRRTTSAIVAWGVFVVLSAQAACCAAQEQSTGEESLFDGRSFAGWNGDTTSIWRIEEGQIVAGSPDATAPRNEFLATDREFSDFELRLEYKLEASAGANAGVQFRSVRLADHHEVSGYQADIGPGYFGALYDESRRNTLLAVPAERMVAAALAGGIDGWHSYRIRAEGKRIRLELNGVETVDWIEPDDGIAKQGMIALQIHGGLVGTIRYRNIRIRPLDGGK
ncbi:MAG: DUF1080 domain-containing protein [Planctomycetota bacterium]|nr:MAG: DUF1080 domain-containing protein [Planctomycetota bacterium]